MQLRKSKKNCMQYVWHVPSTPELKIKISKRKIHTIREFKVYKDEANRVFTRPIIIGSFVSVTKYPKLTRAAEIRDPDGGRAKDLPSGNSKNSWNGFGNIGKE